MILNHDQILYQSHQNRGYKSAIVPATKKNSIATRKPKEKIDDRLSNPLLLLILDAKSECF